MPKVKNPETIFDRRRLLEALRGATTVISTDALRRQALELLTPAHDNARAEIYRRFDEHGKSYDTIYEISWLMDEIISLLFELASRHFLGKQKPQELCVAAVGGYGRQKLFPHSDIDIMFLYSPPSRKAAENIAEFILYILWDMRLTIGQSLRSIDETIAQSLADITTRTSVLDARFVCGDKKFFAHFSQRFKQEVIEGQVLDFIRAKLEERDIRHRRWGDSRYVLEPNVKEGKGGLRDLQTLYWIARYSYGISRISELVKLGVLTAAERRTFRKAAEFFSVVRIHLHLLSGRAEERLTFDMQRQIAEKMGYREQGPNKAVERFMKRYFMMTREVGNLTRIFCTVLEAEKKYHARGFLRNLFNRPRRLEGLVLEGSRLDFPKDYSIKDDPLAIMRIFHVAQRRGLDIHPRALQRVTRNLRLIDRGFRNNPQACELFTDMLLAKERGALTLRRMSDAGVLGKFIPDFGRVTGQMQFDMYHVYSVDEHILTAIGILHDIERGNLKDELPLASRVVGSITRRRALYLALLCHDIAKGRGGNHQHKGAEIARKLAARLGVEDNERQLIGWLVENHQLLSDIAFRRDINDPETIRRLADKVKTPERLRLLLLITVADIRAVGPAIWNGWKGSLLRDLYRRTEALLGAGNNKESENRQETKERLRQHLITTIPEWGEAEAEQYLSLGSPVFWRMLDMPEHTQIAPVVMSLPLQQDDSCYEMLHKQDSFNSITELLLCLKDRHGLFAMMSGVLAVSGANIQHARIFTLSNGIAVERFGLQDIQGAAFDMAQKEAELRELIAAALSGRLDMEAELARVRHSYPRRSEPFATEPTVIIHNDISNTHSVIEVTAADKIGLLHDISRALRERGLSISTAHISTYGEQVVDVFYVKDMYGMKITHDTKLGKIKQTLLEVVSE